MYFFVTFSEPVVVTGAPTLTLNTGDHFEPGAADGVARFVGGGFGEKKTFWKNDERSPLKSSSGVHIPPFLATVSYLTSAGAPTFVLPVGADAAGDGYRRGGGAFACFPVAGNQRHGRREGPRVRRAFVGLGLSLMLLRRSDLFF